MKESKNEERTREQRIVQQIAEYLTGQGWLYQLDEENSAFLFTLNTPSRPIKSLRYLLIVQPDGVVTNALLPVGCDPTNYEQMSLLSRFLCRANYGMRLGCFEMGLENGDVRFRCYCSCPDGDVNTEDIEECIYTTMGMVQLFGPGAVSVMYGGATDEEADVQCRRQRSEPKVELLKSFLDLLERKRDSDEENEQMNMDDLFDDFDFDFDEEAEEGFEADVL